MTIFGKTEWLVEKQQQLIAYTWKYSFNRGREVPPLSGLGGLGCKCLTDATVEPALTVCPPILWVDMVIICLLSRSSMDGADFDLEEGGQWVWFHSD